MVSGKTIARLFIASGVFLLVTVACKKEYYGEVGFIGDSIVARWDIPKYFPMTIAENYGRSGSGLEYLWENSCCMNGKTAVILSGTNDIGTTSWNYADDFTAAIDALDAERTIVISILPREKEGDAENVNHLIEEINGMVKDRCEAKGWEFVDCFASMQNNGHINWDFYTDGLHLSDHGYEFLSDEVKRVL